MNQYEVLYIIDANLDDEAIHASIEKYKALVESNKGEVVEVNEWGKKKLAYAIDYKTEGYYVLMYFNADATLPKELERNMKIDEQLLRYMVVRKVG